MLANDESKFRSLIEALCAAFGRDPSKATFTAYWIGLEQLEITDVVRAVEKAIKTSKHMPSVADIRSMAGVMSDETRAMHAWQAVQSAMREHGTYESIRFDDPIIHAAIRSMGGWTWLGEQEDDWAHNWGRRTFILTYKAFMDTGISAEQAEYLPGLHEAENIISAPPGHITPVIDVKTDLPALPARMVRNKLASKENPLALVDALVKSKTIDRGQP